MPKKSERAEINISQRKKIFKSITSIIKKNKVVFIKLADKKKLMFLRMWEIGLVSLVGEHTLVLTSFSRRQLGNKFTLIDVYTDTVTKMLTVAQFKI